MTQTVGEAALVLYSELLSAWFILGPMSLGQIWLGWSVDKKSG